MKNKMKILISTIALVGGAMPLGAFVCAAGTSNTNEPINPVNNTTLRWQVQDTHFGNINVEQATSEITEDTDFGDLTLPKLIFVDNCHFAGWYGKIDGADQQLTATTTIPASSAEFIITAKFYPDIKDVIVPENLVFTKESASESPTGTIQSEIEWADEALTATPTYQWKLASTTSSVLSIEESTATQSAVTLKLLNPGTEQVILTVDNGGRLISRTCNVTVQKEVDPVKGIKFSTDEAGTQTIDSISLEYDDPVMPVSRDFYYHLIPSQKHELTDVTFSFIDADIPLTIERVEESSNIEHMRVSLDTTKEITSFKTLALFTYSKDDATISNTIQIVVRKHLVPINSITLTTPTNRIAPEASATITATVAGPGVETPTYPDAISWKSSNPSLVKVDKDGNIKAANATGKAIITATAIDNPTAPTPVSAEITITVVDEEWTVDVSADHEEWIDGEGDAQWTINATDTLITIEFATTELFYKVKDEDIQLTYKGQLVTVPCATIQTIGKKSVISINPEGFFDHEAEIRELTVDLSVNEYYDVYLEAGTGVRSIKLDDDILAEDVVPGATFTGTLDLAWQTLCLPNCYVVWGDRTDPETSQKLIGNEGISWKQEQATSFAVLTPTEAFEPTVHQVTIHIDASSTAWWSGIEDNDFDNIYLGLDENTYTEDAGQIVYTYHTKNGYRIDEANTFVTIGEETYPLNGTDPQGVFVSKNGKLFIHPHVAQPGAKADIAIELTITTIANDFACAVEYEDSTLFDNTKFEVVTAKYNQDVVIKVKPTTGNVVVADDTSRLYATVTLIEGNPIIATDIEVSAPDSDGIVTITMTKLSEEYMALVTDIVFFVAADPAS